MKTSDYNIDFEIDSLAAEPEEAYRANRELNMAWQIVEETGANLFLTGKAGTGKTTFLRKLRELSAKQMVVLAPTGVAAINARGNTIHSFFQLPFSLYVPGKGFLSKDKKYLNISKQKRRLISSLSLIVIDEISMVRPDTLDAIDAMLRRLRNSSLPFGGIQLLLIGDLRQLPPVVRENEWELLKEYYPTPYFFESHALQRAGYVTVELSVVYRQSDARFVEILNAIRDGKTDAATLSQLNSRCIPGFSPADNEGYIRLTTHNRQAAHINDTRLQALPTEPFTYEAEIRGDFPESAYPAEQRLTLKEGAQVMFIKNDTGSVRRYYNGLIGTVVSLSDEKVVVKPTDGEPIEVTPVDWDNTRYVADPQTGSVRQEEVGTFTQYPLQLAWAITIHKSQGLTFDKAVIDASHSFAAGQTYVALSRCRSLDGLVLEAPIYPRAVITDSDVNSFMDYCESNVPDAEGIGAMKDRYLFTLLAELFDFEPLRRCFGDFHRAASEYLVPLFPHLEKEFNAWRDRISSDLCDVSRRFLASYAGKSVGAELADPDSDLGRRIRKGAEYFLNAIDELTDFIDGLPRGLDNRAYAERLNNTFDPLRYLAELKRQLLSHHSGVNFSLQTFLTAKARAVIRLEIPAPGTPRQKTKAPAARKEPIATKEEKAMTEPESAQKKEKKEKKSRKKPKGYSAFETLRLLREGKSIPEIAEERNLKEGTIGGHIADLIEKGTLTKEEFIDDSTIAVVMETVKSNPGLPSEELFSLVNERLAPNPICYGIYALARRLGWSESDEPETKS